MSVCLESDVTSALESLNRSYREEAGLYLAVRDVTVRQYQALQEEPDLLRFADLFEEKEDLLAIIDQVEAEAVPAKDAVLSAPPDGGPGRARLAGLLDRITQTIEEIRLIESHNAALLERLPVGV
jgi:hypothetical protein